MRFSFLYLYGWIIRLHFNSSTTFIFQIKELDPNWLPFVKKKVYGRNSKKNNRTSRSNKLLCKFQSNLSFFSCFSFFFFSSSSSFLENVKLRTRYIDRGSRSDVLFLFFLQIVPCLYSRYFCLLPPGAFFSVSSLTAGSLEFHDFLSFFFCWISFFSITPHILLALFYIPSFHS